VLPHHPAHAVDRGLAASPGGEEGNALLDAALERRIGLAQGLVPLRGQEVPRARHALQDLLAHAFGQVRDPTLEYVRFQVRADLEIRRRVQLLEGGEELAPDVALMLERGGDGIALAHLDTLARRVPDQPLLRSGAGAARAIPASPGFRSRRGCA